MQQQQQRGQQQQEAAKGDASSGGIGVRSSNSSRRSSSSGGGGDDDDGDDLLFTGNILQNVVDCSSKPAKPVKGNEATGHGEDAAVSVLGSKPSSSSSSDGSDGFNDMFDSSVLGKRRGSLSSEQDKTMNRRSQRCIDGDAAAASSFAESPQHAGELKVKVLEEERVGSSFPEDVDSCAMVASCSPNDVIDSTPCDQVVEATPEDRMEHSIEDEEGVVEATPSDVSYADAESPGRLGPNQQSMEDECSEGVVEETQCEGVIEEETQREGVVEETQREEQDLSMSGGSPSCVPQTQFSQAHESGSEVSATATPEDCSSWTKERNLSRSEQAGRVCPEAKSISFDEGVSSERANDGSLDDNGGNSMVEAAETAKTDAESLDRDANQQPKGESLAEEAYQQSQTPQRMQQGTPPGKFGHGGVEMAGKDEDVFQDDCNFEYYLSQVSAPSQSTGGDNRHLNHMVGGFAEVYSVSEHKREMQASSTSAVADCAITADCPSPISKGKKIKDESYGTGHGHEQGEKACQGRGIEHEGARGQTLPGCGKGTFVTGDADAMATGGFGDFAGGFGGFMTGKGKAVHVCGEKLRKAAVLLGVEEPLNANGIEAAPEKMTLLHHPAAPDRLSNQVAGNAEDAAAQTTDTGIESWEVSRSASLDQGIPPSRGGFITGKGKPVVVSEEKIREAGKLFGTFDGPMFDSPAPAAAAGGGGFGGFTTGKGKPVVVSEDSVEQAGKLFDQQRTPALERFGHGSLSRSDTTPVGVARPSSIKLSSLQRSRSDIAMGGASSRGMIGGYSTPKPKARGSGPYKAPRSIGAPVGSTISSKSQAKTVQQRGAEPATAINLGSSAAEVPIVGFSKRLKRQGNTTSLREAVHGAVPFGDCTNGNIEIAEYIRISAVTSANAMRFKVHGGGTGEFQGCRELVGPDEMKAKLLEGGASAEYATDDWVVGQYKHIVWKLVCMERAFPSVFGGWYLTADRLLLQLQNRYERMFVRSERSFLQKVAVKDQCATQHAVLCVETVMPAACNPAACEKVSPHVSLHAGRSEMLHGCILYIFLFMPSDYTWIDCTPLRFVLAYVGTSGFRKRLRDSQVVLGIVLTFDDAPAGSVPEAHRWLV